MKNRTISGLAVAFLTTMGLVSPVMVMTASANTEEVQFICENSGAGLSAVDVLSATGEHDVFLKYLSQFDPEGYQILTDPELSDKTIWAPTDEAFAKLGDAPASASPEEIKAVLGFHITPPRRTPEGDYPIITFDYLADGGQIIHQTRTGILTESDQRVTTKFEDGRYTVEGVQIGPTAWCTQTGSIFSIGDVITEVATPSWLESALGSAIYLLFFEYPYVTLIIGIVLVLAVAAIIFRWLRSRER